MSYWKSVRRSRVVVLAAVIALLAMALPGAVLAQGFGPGKAGERALRSQSVPAEAVAATFQVVASGLDNPRGVTMGPDRAIYVAEAGEGGDTCINPDPGDPTFVVCYGNTGAVTRIDLKKGTQSRVLTGLPSHSGTEGIEAIGPSDVSFQGLGNGLVTIGLGADPAVRAMLGAGFSRLVRFQPNGSWSFVADLGQHEADHNPDGGLPDTNPNGVVALPDDMAAVADAGANALIGVNTATGATNTLAVFPNRNLAVPLPLQGPPFFLPPVFPVQAVPDSVVRGPDGALYVGQLTGFPFLLDEAKVYRVVPGQDPVVYAEGFTNIIDLGFGPDGKLYVLEIAKNGLVAAFLGGDWTGALIRVEANGSQTEIASDGLTAPGGMAFGKDGAAYVSNNSIHKDIGEVLRVPLH